MALLKAMEERFESEAKWVKGPLLPSSYQLSQKLNPSRRGNPVLESS
jgi:hypothetical protein